MSIYIDDCLIIVPSDAKVMKFYDDLKTNFKVTTKALLMNTWESK